MEPYQWEVIAEIISDHIRDEERKRQIQLEYAERSKKPPRESSAKFTNRINSLREIHRKCVEQAMEVNRGTT